MTTKHTFKENALRVVAVIGLIAVLLLGAWGIIQLAFFIPTFLSNIAGGSTPKAPTEQAATTTTVVVQQPVVTAPAQAPAKTPAKTTTKASSGTKYVASAQPRVALYGYSDLQVRIVNAPTSVRNGQQISLQFVVENAGTNVVPANWFFTASLPYNPAYTYQSPSQQALYPGDKIVYTLGYTAIPANNQVCTMQYPNYNCPTTGYTDPAAGWNYGTDPNAWMYGGTYNPNYNQNYGYGQTSTASVTVDPYNLVSELNESNNTAGISYQVY